MHSRVILTVSSIAIILLMVSSSVINADDQYNPRARKIASGVWLPAHHYESLGKRGRFVFRDAPNAHHYDPINDAVYIDDDAQDSGVDVNKRNWRL
jgi:hypothetical protein